MNEDDLELEQIIDTKEETEKFMYQVWATGINTQTQESLYEVKMSEFVNPVDAINYANLLTIEKINQIKPISTKVDLIQISVDSILKTLDCGTVYKTELLNV